MRGRCTKIERRRCRKRDEHLPAIHCQGSARNPISHLCTWGKIRFFFLFREAGKGRFRCSLVVYRRDELFDLCIIPALVSSWAPRLTRAGARGHSAKHTNNTHNAGADRAEFWQPGKKWCRPRWEKWGALEIMLAISSLKRLPAEDIDDIRVRRSNPFVMHIFRLIYRFRAFRRKNSRRRKN